MSSAAQIALTEHRMGDYGLLATATIVGYDYLLTFPDEVEYIWTKPWTSVSTLFVLVRYSGLCNLTSLVLGELARTMFTIRLWTFLLLLGSSDLMMILRVWAMYARSRIILAILGILYVLEIASTFAVPVVASEGRNLLLTPYQSFGLSFCSIDVTLQAWPLLVTICNILQLVFGATLCILAVIQFVRQSLQMHRMRKEWQINQYLYLFVKQGLLYFFAIFLITLQNVLSTAENLNEEQGWQLIVFYTLEGVPLYALAARFIMSIRELYARDSHVGRRSDIDTGFGLSTSAAVGEMRMEFADAERSEGPRVAEDIPMDIHRVEAGPSGTR